MTSRRGHFAIGIDIATDAVRVAVVDKKRVLSVRNMSVHPIGMGALGRDSAVNWGGLEQTLKAALSEHKLKGKRVHVAIPSALTVIRQLTLPDFSDEELRSVIEFELTNSIHLPFEQAVFDFVRCPPSEETSPKETNVILIAADRQFVDRLVEALRHLGIRPASIDIKSLATYRALKRLDTLPTTFLLAESNAQGTFVHVFHQGLLYLTRQVPVELMTSVIETLDSTEPSPFATNAAEVQPIFTDVISDESIPPSILRDNATIDHLPMENYVNRMGAEIDRTVNFFRYTLNQRQATFEEVIFTGAEHLTEEAKGALTERLGITCKSLSFEQIVDGNHIAIRRGMVNSDNQRLDDYTAAIGLALREV